MEDRSALFQISGAGGNNSVGGGEDAAEPPKPGGVSVRRRRVRERAGESQIGIKGAAFPRGLQFSSTSSTQDKMKCIVSISPREILDLQGASGDRRLGWIACDFGHTTAIPVQFCRICCVDGNIMVII